MDNCIFYFAVFQNNFIEIGGYFRSSASNALMNAICFPSRETSKLIVVNGTVNSLFFVTPTSSSEENVTIARIND